MSFKDDEGHYGPKQLNLLKVVWGEGCFPGGTAEIDEIMTGVDATGRTVLDIGCGCGGAAFHLLKKYNVKSVEGIDPEPLVIQTAKDLAIKNKLEDVTTFKQINPGPLQYAMNLLIWCSAKKLFAYS